MNKSITLQFSRETKGAILYEEPGRERGDPHYLIGNLYLRKAALKNNGQTTPPLSITVTVNDEQPQNTE